MMRAFLAVLTTSLAIAGSTACAQDPDAEFTEYEGMLWVLLDDSHDLMHITADGDRVEVQILMFAQSDFTQVPETWDIELLEDLATTVRSRQIRIDQIHGILVGCGSGHDVVWTDPDFPLVVNIEGGAGNDFLYGGAENDVLDGGMDNDSLYGEGGDDELYGENNIDYLFGGDGDDYLNGGRDGYRDVLTGGRGVDEFIQFVRTLRVGTNRAPGGVMQITEESLRDLANEDILSLGPA